MVENMRPRFRRSGPWVHSAPFYVLIGANMPSILAEIACSHPRTRKAQEGDYRERGVRPAGGVRSYLDALNRTQSQKLTQAPRKSTVVSEDDRR